LGVGEEARIDGFPNIFDLGDVFSKEILWRSFAYHFRILDILQMGCQIQPTQFYCGCKAVFKKKSA